MRLTSKLDVVVRVGEGVRLLAMLARAALNGCAADALAVVVVVVEFILPSFMVCIVYALIRNRFHSSFAVA
jgi:hypothetical protein